MRAIILAAGKQTRWQNYLGVPKHLIPIKGEPLIHRTQRMLADRGVDDIQVVTRNRAYILPRIGTQAYPRPVDRDWEHEAESSRHLWNTDGRTLLLYGDVYFSDKLLNAMTADPGDPWRVYARHDGSRHTGKAYGEMFGWVFTHDHHGLLDAARTVAIAYHDTGLWDRCIGWEVYRIATQQLPWHHSQDDVHFAQWDDVSDDFDGPSDWDEWAKLNPRLW